MTTLDTRQLRNAFGSFMTGVTVVTCKSSDGSPLGFTANSFSSVSMDPPLLLVCPAKSLSSFEAFEQCESFAVNILAENQKDISNIFASSKDDRFSQINWQEDANGCPIIDGVVTSFSCKKHNIVDAGDHIILIGEVNDFVTNDILGLGYFRGGYFSLGLEREAAEVGTSNSDVSVGLVIEHKGKVLLSNNDGVYKHPTVNAKKGEAPSEVIAEFIKSKALNVRLGAVYSVFENKQSGKHSIYFRAIAQDNETHELGDYYDIPATESLAFESVGVTSMMKRFALERQNGVFQLYIGDEIEGSIHSMKEGE